MPEMKTPDIVKRGQNIGHLYGLYAWGEGGGRLHFRNEPAKTEEGAKLSPS